VREKVAAVAGPPPPPAARRAGTRREYQVTQNPPSPAVIVKGAAGAEQRTEGDPGGLRSRASWSQLASIPHALAHSALEEVGPEVDRFRKVQQSKVTGVRGGLEKTRRGEAR